MFETHQGINGNLAIEPGNRRDEAGRSGLLTRRSFVAGASAGLALLPGMALQSQAIIPNASPRIIDATQALGAVERGIFGLNLLATRDRLSGTYGDRIPQFRPSLLRWPGGEITHQLFTASGQVNWTFETNLWEFLRYCEANDVTPSIVVPADTVNLSFWQYRLAVRGLILVVNRAMQSSHNPVIWSFGNENYAGPDFLPSIYAAYFRYFREELNIYRSKEHGYTDLVSINAGPPTGAIASWADPLSHLISPDDYDLISYHSYPTDYFIYTLRHLDTARQYLGNKPAYLSEWNQYACWNPAWNFPGGNCPSEEFFFNATYGMSLAGAMVSHFSQMIPYNVPYAAFWAVQQNNMTSMFPNEGLLPNQSTYVTGATFDWLRDTEGMTLVAMEQTNSEDVPAFFAYADDNRMFVFIDARRATGRYEVEIVNFPFIQYWGNRLSGANDARDVIPAISGARVTRLGNVIRVPLRVSTSHELIRIELRK